MLNTVRSRWLRWKYQRLFCTLFPLSTTLCVDEDKYKTRRKINMTIRPP